MSAPSDTLQDGRISAFALPLTLIYDRDAPVQEVITISDQSLPAISKTVRQKINVYWCFDTTLQLKYNITAHYTIRNGRESQVSFTSTVHEENWSATKSLFRRFDVYAIRLTVCIWLVPLEHPERFRQLSGRGLLQNKNSNNHESKNDKKEQAGARRGSDGSDINPPPYEAHPGPRTVNCRQYRQSKDACNSSPVEEEERACCMQ